MYENEFDIVAPAAASMIESLRAYGYTPAAAIADIIDNSISAKAKNVWIDFHWSGQDSYVSILDDGSGMEENTLVAAMRPGSQNPLKERDPKDLGRFGMGLKTASFSQCRRLTVKTKIDNNHQSTRRWDINHVIKVDDWQLLRTAFDGSELRLAPLDDIKRGTIVLWEDLDKLIGKQNEVHHDADQKRFYIIYDEVRAYLGMVFHIYLSGINPSLRIFTNNQLIKPWDPFCEENTATYSSPNEQIKHPHGDTFIKGFVLPHKDRVRSEEYERNAGPGGWYARQGIYIYRNKRLLVAGGWHGLGIGKPWMQEEQYKLARIKVEINNTQDFDWLIDVKKSTAKPPAWVKDRLVALSGQIRESARQVFIHRGAYGPRQKTHKIFKIWLANNKNGRWSYKIDRTHYLIKEISDKLTLTQAHKDIFRFLLRTLEETVPIPGIWLAAAENPDNYEVPFESSDDMEKRRMVEISYRILKKQGLKHDVVISRLMELEEYQDPAFAHIFRELRD